MGTLAIVEEFDVIEDLTSSLGAGLEVASVDEFQLEGAPEAFHSGVIVAVALAAHGGDQAGLGQGGPINGRGVLNTAIGSGTAGWSGAADGAKP